MRYRATFIGRKVGAIGLQCHVVTACEGADAADAKLDVYARFEHIVGAAAGIKLTPLADGEQVEELYVSARL